MGGLRKSGIRCFRGAGGAGGGGVGFRERQTEWWRLRKSGGLTNMVKFDTPNAYVKLSFMACGFFCIIPMV